MRALLLTGVLCLCTVAHAQWPQPTYLANGGVWRLRVPIEIRNDTDQDAAGTPVSLRVGAEPGQVALPAQVPVEELRLCDAAGTELLLRVDGPSGERLTAGPIPPGSVLTVPAVCPAGGRATSYLYAENPATWPVPDFLQTRAAPAEAREGDTPTGALLSATARAPERLEHSTTGGDAPWYDDDPADDIGWDCRAPVRVTNLSDRPVEDTPALVDMARLNVLMRDRLRPESLRVTADGEVIPHQFLGEQLAFTAQVAANRTRVYYVYLSEDERIPATAAGSFAGMLDSPANRAGKPDYANAGDLRADHWPGGAEGKQPAGFEADLDTPGLVGDCCLRLRIPHNVEASLTGWREMIPVEAGRHYLFATWVRTEDVRGNVRVHAHYRDADRKLCESRKHASPGRDLTGTNGWTLLSKAFTTPADAAFFELHVTMNATGTVWSERALMAEVSETWLGELGTPAAAADDPDLRIWPVNALVKLFRDDLPPREVLPARVSAARNEREPLQLAVRCAGGSREVRAVVEPPANAQGETLPAPEIAVVGYVPVDRATGYFRVNVPDWQRQVPTATRQCDGWAGWWPDPLLPTDSFDLQPDRTQPIWLTFEIPADARAGDYHGTVSLVSGDRTVAEAPFTVHVWRFALAEGSSMRAIYDLRAQDRLWRPEGKTRRDAFEESARFLSERGVCANRPFPDPVITYEDGRASADFTEFDEAARYYFDELDLPHAYTPRYFLCFGWGHPPKKAWGEEPYEGEHPYENADRAKLRPEYKRAYQACLKVYWDHLKQMGWADRFVHYISDEPFYQHDHIVDQMRALCDMIHEVDADIPIYCSTWRHVPAWDGYLDIWGVGHDGRVPPEQLAKLRAAGDRVWWTIDGMQCIDTPYCAVERLLPHYCLKYDAEAYECWGVDWLTYDPWQFGWHSYNTQSGAPGEHSCPRFSNGAGYLMYPGAPIGHDGPVSTIRLEQVREGDEDHEYLVMLRDLTQRARAQGRDVAQAEAALTRASGLVDMPNAGGRYSTQILPDPDALMQVRRAVAEAIEGL